MVTRTVSGLALAVAMTLGLGIMPANGTSFAGPHVAPSSVATSPTRARELLPVVNLYFERRVLALTNAQRARYGCRPLALNLRLRTAARGHSRKMARARSMAHQLPGEPALGRRITLAGYFPWTVTAENIAAGYILPYTVVSAWMRSPSHRRNILDCRLKEVGVGVVTYGLRKWWTQDFGVRRS